MIYRIFLLWIIATLSSPPASAEEPVRYRIELLVLRHLDARTEARRVPDLRDFSAALDLTQPAQPPEAAAGDPLPPAEPATGPSAGASATDDRDAAAEPPAAVWIEQPGDTMQEAWRLLRLSAGFRPELYFSWEQADAAPFPLVRVHDAELLREDDSGAGQRDGAAAPDAAVPAAADGGEAAGAGLPEPTRYYRIDGTARLRRARFLHLELDIEWREAIAGLDLAAPDEASGSAPAPPRPDAFQIHRIQQNRPVRTQQVEYFDGPFLGVLAVISRIAAEGDPSTAEDLTGN
jgi:hypothetical protein